MGFKKISMKMFSKVLSFFKLSEEEKAIYYNEISQENTRRFFYLLLIAIPVSIVHIVLFALKIEAAAGIERQWVFSIIYSHLTFMMLSVGCAIFLYFTFYRSVKNSSFSRRISYFILVLLLLLGNALTSFDQYVTPAITPFLNTTLLVALLFQIRPVYSTIFFTGSYVVFYFAVSHTQLNQDVLISNLVNGLSISVIGVGLSMILWHSKLTRIVQREKISRQNLELCESNAEKDKFFSIIAHDLKSPFNSILGFSEILIDQVKRKDYEGIDEYAEIIRQSSKSAMDLLMNLMEWSKAHTGKIEFKPEKIVLDELFKEVEALFAGAMLQKKIRCSFHVSEEVVVFADKNMIRTILRNLISNAIKFTHLDGQIVLSVVSDGNEQVISVSDNGVGIPKESIDKIFRIDQNYTTLGTQREKGTGLGLILCKELIEKHGGRIWAESEFGKGSTFHISLPLISKSVKL